MKAGHVHSGLGVVTTVEGKVLRAAKAGAITPELDDPRTRYRPTSRPSCRSEVVAQPLVDLTLMDSGQAFLTSTKFIARCASA